MVVLPSGLVVVVMVLVEPSGFFVAMTVVFSLGSTSGCMVAVPVVPPVVPVPVVPVPAIVAE